VLAFPSPAMRGKATAGHVFTFARFDLESGERIGTTTMHLQEGRLRIDQVDDEGERSTLLFDRTHLYNIDMDRRDYSLVDAEVLGR
jgi:hypothetical protein